MGFPHSEINGSMPALGSPSLIAECHVFHRLLTPRHSPDALLLLERSSQPTVAVSCAEQKRPTKYTHSQFAITFFRCNKNHNGKSRSLHIPDSQCQITHPPIFIREILSLPNLFNKKNKDQNAGEAKMVEVNGIEPMTSCLQSRRSPN